jgi:HEAT repeat protein
VVKALDAGRIDQAVDGVAALVRKELEAKSDDGKRAFTVALRRLLVDHNLDHFAGYLLDDLYADDVVTILRRAGKPGTKVLIERLVQAKTFAERKAYLNVLRDVEEGTEAVAGMLSHSEWYVVRNMADLAGELRIQEAVPALGRAIENKDDRVRRSAGVALAKIGTPQTVAFLRKVLDDPDPKVRIAIFAEVGGRGHGSLAMPLVAATEKEEVAEVRAQYYRALGRIGTPDAVNALKHVAEPGGRLLGRRAAGERVAAVEGLALAGTDQARAALESLRDDRAKEVREAAVAGLRGASSG